MPTITLKNIKVSEALSEETQAYTADIWVDGRKRGYVRNDGNGGCDLISPPDLAREVEAHAKTLPPLMIDGKPYTQDADTFLHSLLDDWYARRDLKRLMKKSRVLLRDGKFFKAPLTFAPLPGDRCLNDMPFEEAVRLYRWS